ncbi:MAG: right-handed parallel beta-helix repeat-containing protein [Phycisphaerales bacterium]|nr:right-handed parallel beta-helix repeat-containing protein [Phycisphaerales bacterium]
MKTQISTRNRFGTAILTVLAGCGLAGHAMAADLLVPTTFTSIQAAINASADQDVIVLAPGQYAEQLELVGRSLTIRSSTGNPADVTIGILGGGTIAKITDSPSVKFQGVTLRGGRGERGLVCGSTGSITIFAGAILGTSSGIELDQCVVRDNTADLGGAFFLSAGSLVIRRSTIADNGNTASPGSTASVGAVLRTCDRSAPATILIEDSLVTGNGDLSDGLDCISPFNGVLTVRRTRFADNFGAVIQPLGLTDVTVEDSEFIGNGGVRSPITIALASGDVKLNVTGTRFEGNEGDSAGDIFVATPAFSNSEIKVTNCKFINSQNSSIIYTPDQGGSGVFDRNEFRGSASIGIGVFASGGTTVISNSLFVGNVEGVFVANASDPATTTIANCTIVGSLNMGIRLDALLTGTLNVRNTIVTGNAVQQIGAPLIPIGQTISVERSIVQGGYPGAGNLSVNPGFVNGSGLNGDYRLSNTSPAIDAGDNAGIPANLGSSPSLDLAGNPRQADAPSVTDTGLGTSPIVDIGAYEFVATTAVCVADFDNSGSAGVSDIFEYLNAWFASQPRADLDGSGVGVSDIFVFLNTWFAGCP